jgi:hypothetical protein
VNFCVVVILFYILLFSKFIISECTGIGPLIDVFNILTGLFSHSPVGEKKISKCFNAKFLCCFAVLYLKIVHDFGSSKSPRFNQYLTLHVQCSAPTAFLNDIYIYI